MRKERRGSLTKNSWQSLCMRRTSSFVCVVSVSLAIAAASDSPCYRTRAVVSSRTVEYGRGSEEPRNNKISYA